MLEFRNDLNNSGNIKNVTKTVVTAQLIHEEFRIGPQEPPPAAHRFVCSWIHLVKLADDAVFAYLG